ncbi:MULTISPECIES: hypothetical protein [Serratia]|uniref:hypothetical protein n=1 Tax=Serratia TaxID=613 RepID=UPI001F46DCFC|nr:MULTISPECIES: hypothetical protein [Serratia]MCE9941349.1 hypothetical protein [Serratia liquefaciens]
MDLLLLAQVVRGEYLAVVMVQIALELAVELEGWEAEGHWGPLVVAVEQAIL